MNYLIHNNSDDYKQAVEYANNEHNTDFPYEKLINPVYKDMKNNF